MNPPKFLLATGNLHKVQEIRDILGAFPVLLDSLESHPGVPVAAEDGVTYTENALQKARHYARATGAVALADDSGLEVDALDGRPGIHSARFAGADTPHSEKIKCLLGYLRDVPPEQRTARFRCVAALVRPDGSELTAEGVVEGQIASAPSGQGGFGYDPVFFVPEQGCTMAQVDARVKNRISHRARAFLGMMEKLGLEASGQSSSPVKRRF